MKSDILIKNIVNSSLDHGAIAFSSLDNSQFLPAIRKLVTQLEEKITEISTNADEPNFRNTVEAMEFAQQPLNQVSVVFFNLFNACVDDVIQKDVTDISQMLAKLSNDISLNENLFTRYKAVFDKQGEGGLSQEQKELLQKEYDSFVRNGANLSDEDKEKLRAIDKELASLSPKFGDNVLKATNSTQIHVDNELDLTGLPESVLAQAAALAKDKGKDGWIFTMQAPCYVPFMKYAENRDLREKMWRAFNSRALSGEFSNKENCINIARLRDDRAKLLGYSSHAAFVLEKRMAKTPDKVNAFLSELKEPSLKAARRELQELKEFIGDEVDTLMPWDFAFYSEKLKQKTFQFSEDDLKQFFELNAVLQGVFAHANKLYDLEFLERDDLPVYHEEVRVFEVKKNNEFIGLFYVDLFPRENKKPGAWMTNMRQQGHNGTEVKRPHVSIVCNFTKPVGDKPSLLTHDEVTTLFHEFGHALHGLLSRCTYCGISGTSVLWDFVELPSQFMENFTFEKEALDLFAKHHKTGESMPVALVEKLKKSAKFQAGYVSARQVRFGTLDMYWHHDIEGKNLDPEVVEREALREFDILPAVENTCMSVSFAHIFQGGYSAGYYSYKWAEVLDADAFAYFQEKGIFNREVADKFYEHILSRGGSDDPEILYRQFRGQDPDAKALLKRSGLL